MRRQARPADLAAEAETVQPLRFVAVDARRENLRFPSGGSHLAALQLTEHGQQARLAVEPRSRRRMLPTQQEPHEVGRRDRLDFFS